MMEQLTFWAEPVRREARDMLETARQHWVETRLHYAVGSPEELEAWRAYKEASDRVWEMLRAQGA